MASCGGRSNSSEADRNTQLEDCEKTEENRQESIRNADKISHIEQETLTSVDDKDDYKNTTTVWQDGPLKVFITLSNGKPQDARLELRSSSGELLCSGSLMENSEIRNGQVFYGENANNFVGCVMINLEAGNGIVKSRVYTNGEITKANFKRIK